MPHQPTLFHEKQKPRANEDGFVWVQEAPQGSPETDARAERNGAYADIQAKASGLQKRYLSLLKRVAREGQPTESGEVIHALTDAEAAALMQVGRSTICGRRNELQGGSNCIPGTEENPLVVKAERRVCHVKENTAAAWTASPDLFTQPD